MRYRLLHIIILLVTFCSAYSQTDAGSLYKEACRLNDLREYSAAAAEFRKAGKIALSAKEYDLYMRSILAAGECYYMMNAVPAMREILDEAIQGYRSYSYSANRATRLQWLEGCYKLEGSYSYCLTDVDTTAYHRASVAYRYCLELLDSLRNESFYDDGEAEVIIHRELLSLYYKQKNYSLALLEAETVYYFYQNTGFVEWGTSPNVRKWGTSPNVRVQWGTSENVHRWQRLNDSYVDAVVSYAMVLARLNRYEDANAVLSELPKTCENIPSVLRAKGKICVLQHDYDGTGSITDAKHYYMQYVESTKNRIVRDIRKMTQSEREYYWLSLHDFLFDCCRLEDSATELLYDLTLFCKGFLVEYGKTDSKSYKWSDVQKSLGEDDCAIEFVLYNGASEQKQLGALVVTRQSDKPVFVHITDAEDLKNLPLGRGVTVGNAVTSTDVTDKNILYNDRSLPSRIWTEKLMEVIGSAKNIYFAPDGLLHQLAIEYMMPDTARVCKRLTSTRVLVSNDKINGKGSLMMMGNIDYSTAEKSDMHGNDASAYSFFQPYAHTIEALPGTKAEIDSIMICRGAAGDMVKERAQATDSAFRATAPLFPILHVATHGFFVGNLEGGTELKPLETDNCMSQSGLLFSGAKYALCDSLHNPSLSDGLLSAKELSQMQLANTELVVLSACQTGAGYITADGVYGIQRALKQAGVKAMIVSLWNVDDYATSVLMSRFYKNLNEGKEPYDSFMAARCQLMQLEKTVFNAGSMSARRIHKYAQPQYADAFILIDVK